MLPNTEQQAVCLTTAQRSLLDLLSGANAKTYYKAVIFALETSIYQSDIPLDNKEKSHLYLVKELTQQLKEMY